MDDNLASSRGPILPLHPADHVAALGYSSFIIRGTHYIILMYLIAFGPLISQQHHDALLQREAAPKQRCKVHLQGPTSLASGVGGRSSAGTEFDLVTIIGEMRVRPKAGRICFVYSSQAKSGSSESGSASHAILAHFRLSSTHHLGWGPK